MVIPRLSVDLKNELPEIKGFSERNIKRMLTFFREYPTLGIAPPPVAQLSSKGKLMEKIKDRATRLWYVQQTIEQGLSRDTLATMIKCKTHDRQGKAVSNFAGRPKHRRIYCFG